MKQNWKTRPELLYCGGISEVLFKFQNNFRFAKSSWKEIASGKKTIFFVTSLNTSKNDHKLHIYLLPEYFQNFTVFGLLVWLNAISLLNIKGLNIQSIGIMTRKTNEYICIIKVQKVCYKIHLVNMCINVVRVIIELIVQYYNILDGTQYMFIPLSLDESLVQQNLQVFLQ